MFVAELKFAMLGEYPEILVSRTLSFKRLDFGVKIQFSIFQNQKGKIN